MFGRILLLQISLGCDMMEQRSAFGRPDAMTNTHPLSRAKWIGARPECQSPVLIRQFNAGDVTDATLYVTGLGYFEARINGMAVTEDRFLPLVTDYEPRDLS